MNITATAVAKIAPVAAVFFIRTPVPFWLMAGTAFEIEPGLGHRSAFTVFLTAVLLQEGSSATLKEPANRAVGFLRARCFLWAEKEGKTGAFVLKQKAIRTTPLWSRACAPETRRLLESWFRSIMARCFAWQ
jgi:hypothetical protein